MLGRVLKPAKDWYPSELENRVGRYSTYVDEHAPTEITFQAISKHERDSISKDGLINAGFQPDKF